MRRRPSIRSANLTFNSSGQAAEAVSANAAIGSQTLPAASVTTTVDQQSKPAEHDRVHPVHSRTGLCIYLRPGDNGELFPGPTPTSPIPIASFTAQLDGTQSLTVTSLGSNQYQVPVGLLSGGSHSVAIHLAASPSYAAAAATVSLAVQKANVTPSVAGAPVAGTYGTAIPITLDLTGLSGTGFAAPTGTVNLVIDNLAPQPRRSAAATASFTAPAGLSANTHSMNFNYSGDRNYAAQILTPLWWSSKCRWWPALPCHPGGWGGEPHV